MRYESAPLGNFGQKKRFGGYVFLCQTMSKLTEDLWQLLEFDIRWGGGLHREWVYSKFCLRGEGLLERGGLNREEA